MTNDDTGRTAPRITIGDAIRTTVLAYEAEIGKLEDRGPDFAADLARRLFGIMRTWAASETDSTAAANTEAIDVLGGLYVEIHDMYVDRPDRTALALALGAIQRAGHRYGVDVQSGQDERYPEQSIVIEAAGMLVSDHVQRMITTSLPGHAAALLITVAGERRRHDLVAKLVEGGPDSDPELRKQMLASLAQVLGPYKHEVVQGIRNGRATR